MKKTLIALALAGLASSAFAIGESGQSGQRYLSNIKVTGQNHAAYMELSSSEWGTTVYSIDLSSVNPYGREMLSLAMSAINTGRLVSFTVDTVTSGTNPYCGHSGGTPVCGWGARVKQIWLHN